MNTSVLIVEDGAIVAVHLRKMLVGLGYIVFTPVASGEEAIAAVAEKQPNLVLMDIQLAGKMDGITAAEQIIAATDVPIIFLTSYSQDPLLQRAKTISPYGYLIKPVSPQELTATIEMALYRHSIDRQLREQEEELSAIFENSPLIMLLLDGERKVCKVNSYAADFANLSAADMLDLLGGNSLHCLHSLDHPEGCGFGVHCQGCTVRQRVMDTFTTGLGHHQEEAGLTLLVNGEEKELSFLLSTTRLNVRQKPMVLVSLQDITKRKEAEKALQKAHDELEIRVQERTADLHLTNTRLNEEIKERQRKEKILRAHLLVREYAGVHGLNDFLTKSLDEVERITGSRIGFLHFLKGEEKTLCLQTWSSATLEIFCKTEAKGRHCPVDKAGVWVDCIHQRRPIIHNDYATLPDRKGLPPGHAEVIRELVVPIMREKRIVAIIGVGNKASDYDDDDVETVVELGDIIWDIVLRKQAMELLFNSKATLTTVFDGISDPLIMLDAELRIKRLNLAARNYYDLITYEEVIGKYCYEAFKGQSAPCEGCEHPLSSLQGFAGSYERKGERDPSRIEQVFVDVVKDEADKPKSYIVRIADITQARLMDRQLIQNEKLASLGLLIAGVAHEINNPNNFIYFNAPILRSYLQFLLPIADEYALAHPNLQVFNRPYGDFREDCFKLLDNIEHGSTRINQIVGNLREFARERGKGEKRRIDLKAVVEKGLSICLGRIKKLVKTIDVQIPDGLPALTSDPIAIEQIVVNLMVNAAHAADKDDSWVRLTIAEGKEPTGEMIVEVSDNGCGIDSETQKKIFDPFFTTKAVGVGTGLGLSISHRLVTELGGRIEVESEVGRGSVFRVVLKSNDGELKQ